MRTPLGRVRYLGSAHGGTDHFWRQRLTGAGNAVLVILALAAIIPAAGRPYEEVVVRLGQPWAATVLILLFVSAAIHMRIGMQTIVEDYVHGEGLKVFLLAASTFFSAAVAVVAVLSLLKLAFGV